MKVAIAILLLATVAIAAVSCSPSDHCGRYEVRACDCPKPCDGPCYRPSKCVCIAGYHRNHLGHCVPDCPSCHHRRNPYPSKK
ncbi:uncharacterized protein LOC119766873 [Culex quinquefasciatus]|uniref:uncharacterized protein LOC119766873 n=1 Tax=Culex quinquefasciatus TaxID=7176 RepID=UPI0018E34660|nr:uncharacterized protein LOC119766873 [Culex quinquefasciatus]